MDTLSDSGFWVSVVQIIWINTLLSGDNAMVIALACRSLPPEQQRRGMILGTGAAILLRILFTGIVAQVMNITFVKAASAVLLFWIAVKLAVPADEDGDGPEAAQSLWHAVQVVVIADIVMSLDNVIAIAAAVKGDTLLIVLGLLISIPMIVAGASLLIRILERYPVLIWAGAALLGWIAGEIFAEDPFIRGLVDPHVAESLERMTGAVGAMMVLSVGWMLARTRRETA